MPNRKGRKGKASIGGVSHGVASKDQISPEVSREELGRRNYEAGHSFEVRVAELYRLLHYEVQLGRIFAGRQLDLFLTGRFGDLIIDRAIECKIGPVHAEHIDSFIAKLRLVRTEYPAAQGTIVSGASFSDAIKAHAAREGLQLTLYRDLVAQLLDGHAYAATLIRECNSNERYPLSIYVEPSIGEDVSGSSYPALSVITRWLQDAQANQLTLLGDVGTGKSFLSRIVAHHLARKFLARPLDAPLPILIDLRNADRQFSLEGLVLTHLAQNGLERVSFEAFQYALGQGNIVLILDGFDEMAARVTPQVTHRNFHELARAVNGRAKVLLTCRTHYFRSRTDEEEVVLGSSQDYGSETARDLYWELIARKGFRIAYLRPFDMGQIERYVRRAIPRHAKKALQTIKHTYNLMELSQRPMLLEMIIKSIDKLNVGEINPATLYKVYTDAWVHRDQWRDVLSPTAKLSFLMALANILWEEDVSTIHHTRLTEYVHTELEGQIQNAQQLLEIDSEIRTASFLVRDDAGNYGFGHKSYAEFFLARYLALELIAGNVDCLKIRRLLPEVIGFMKYLVAPSLEPLLENTLCESYRRQVSENALLCLYGFRRDAYLSRNLGAGDAIDGKLVVPLPPRMVLSGAQLDQVTLEGANLEEADFSNANLSQAILASADLSRANLNGAQLEKADLVKAIFRSANLVKANLVGVNLEKADLSNANLKGADLSDAYLLGVNDDNANFDDVKLTRTVLSSRLSLALMPTALADPGPPFLSDTNLTLEEYWEFIEQIAPQVRRVARRTALAGGIDPDDAVQEISIRLLEKHHIMRLIRLDKDARLKQVYLIAKHVMARSQGSRTREVQFSELDSEYGVRNIINRIASEMDPMDIMVDTEIHEAESKALARIKDVLSEQSWQIIEARYIQGRTVKEIAERENVSVRTIQRHIAKALEIVRHSRFVRAALPN
jgi:RNA polymerase sigma factor (sigma-70 family)